MASETDAQLWDLILRRGEIVTVTACNARSATTRTWIGSVARPGLNRATYSVKRGSLRAVLEALVTMLYPERG